MIQCHCSYKGGDSWEATAFHSTSALACGLKPGRRWERQTGTNNSGLSTSCFSIPVWETFTCPAHYFNPERVTDALVYVVVLCPPLPKPLFYLTILSLFPPSILPTFKELPSCQVAQTDLALNDTP